MWSTIARLVLSFLLSIAAALLNRPPEQESAERETPDFPRVTEGDKLGKVFGTVNVENPQVAWWGDVRVNPIVETGPRRYGVAGPRSRTTVGYRYRVGMHLILSLGPVDRLKAIFSGEKRAFLGNVGNETIRIDRENLHGGDRRGGGLRGNFTVALGGPDQQPSPYLENRSQLDNPQPAYRGVTALIAEQPYVGTQPTPQRFSARLERIRSVDPDYNGGEQWYSDKAPIFQRTVNEQLSVMISLDVSGSMDGQRIETAKGAITGYLEILKSVASEERVDIRIVAWSGEVQGTITRRNANDSDIDALIGFVNGLEVGGGTNFVAALDGAESFFESSSNRSQFLLYFITDGEPTGGSEDDAEVIAGELGSLGVNIYGINIELSDTTETEKIDNTPWDGVPVVRGDQDGPLSDALVGPVAEFDLNPAHIIREVLISPDTGGSGDSSRINNESFEAAADRLYDEGFGLSLLWDGDQSRGDFISLVENHIDARVSQNRRTGLWEIDLIRDDYDEEELFEVDRSNVIEWTNVNRPENHTLQNQVIVKFNKPEVGEQGSITATNGASLRFMDPPMIILEERTYEGIQKSSLASRVASRDLLAVSSPLLRATATMTWLPTELNRGSAVVLNDQKVGIDNVIARITEIRDGDGRDNSIEVDFIEDRFSIGNEGEIAIEEYRPPVIIAEPGDPRLVEEAPYWVLGQETGFSELNQTLSEDPDFGILHVSFGNPNGRVIDGDVRFDDDGDGFEDGGVVDALPSFTLLSRMSRIATQTRVIVETEDSVEDIPQNTIAIIGNEVVEIESIEQGGSWSQNSYWRPVQEPEGQFFTLELKRGCLDTVPDWHHAGDKILPWGINSLISEDFTSGDSVDVKILTSTSREQLTEDEAPTDTVAFNNRAISPYPVGSVQSDGTFISPNYDPNEDYFLTWSHRNRLTQRDEIVGHLDGQAVILDPNRVPDGYEISNNSRTVVNVAGGSDYRRWVPFSRTIGSGDDKIYYWEINVQATQTDRLDGYVGVFPAGLIDDSGIGYDSGENPINADGGIGFRGDGSIWADGEQQRVAVLGSNYEDGDIIMLAFRPSDGSFWTGVNGSWDNDPATEDASYQTPNLSGSGWLPYVQGRDEGDGHTIVTNLASLTYSVPEGAEPFVDFSGEPEDGTSYTVNVDALNAQGQVSEAIESVPVGTDTSYLVEQPTAPSGSVAVRIQIEAERDGYTDYQSGVIYLIDPTNPETVALKGAYFDAAEIGSMFQDENANTPVENDGDPVNRWDSLKGDLL